MQAAVRLGDEIRLVQGGAVVAESPEQIAFESAIAAVAMVEPRVAGAIRAELDSQRHQLKLIASENYASPAVLLAMGNWLSDKYAEGVPGRRMYAGCEQIDEIERIAAGHATALFGADHAYVQPHSGIDANLVAFWAILAKRVERPFLDDARAGHVNDLSADTWEQLRRQLGAQRMMGMSLDAGGHLTHGFRPNISGKMFDQLTGRQAESALLEAGVVTNRNTIPSDRNGPWYTSGVRLGTPALTTLGLGPTEMDEISEIITAALRATSAAPAKSGLSQAHYVIDQKVAEACRRRCADLLSRHPLYPQVHLG